ncbi:MAG: hypothetical protein IT383_26585, partial [Deltaproteobacteria bacterium]|nr:hypothetical protein [Deltaproteobacteria bacterium]
MRAQPARVIAIVASFLTANGCLGPPTDDTPGGSTGTVELKGSVDKGPFVVGSTIAVSPLDEGLSSTGRIYNTRTINDRGEFEVGFDAAGSVLLEGTGFYYNEVTGELSGASLALRALHILSGEAVQDVHVNIITHLSDERIRFLVNGGFAFDDAVAQAEDEIAAELNVVPEGFEVGARGTSMYLGGGDNDANAYLLAVSSVFAQAAALRGGSADANLQELLNTATIDFSDGTLEPDVQGEIAAALLALDVGRIATQLANRFADTGSTSEVPDMNRIIDQDRDGLLNQSDNCPLDPNPSQENADGDGSGDDCDECPGTVCDDECLPAAPELGRPADTCVTPCYSGDSSECEAGFACWEGYCRPAGGEGELCLPEGGCDDATHICLEGAVCVEQGADGQPCAAGGACDSGGPCLPWDQAGCANFGSLGVGWYECCAAPIAQLGEFCIARPCAAGLGCSDGLCMEAGGLGEPCPDDGSACDGALECVQDRSCMETGGDGQPCAA